MKNHSGHTPMAEITYKYEDRIGHVYAKLEYYNPSGSIKDRIASYILGKAEETGQLRPGQPIIETTSGNTGIAIAAYGALAKHPVHIFMPGWVSIERVKLMKMYGANVHLISKEENGFLGALDQTEKLAKELGGFILGQFSNKDNMMAHYNYTAAEILQTLPDVKSFVSGVGSGGTIMGIGTRLKEANRAEIIAIEPDCAQLLAGKKIERAHKIEGIGDDFIPRLLDKKIIDRIIPINDEDAICMSAKFAKELGLGIGISSGANFLGAVLSGKENVATVFADDNKKYLSTSLAGSPAPSDNMVSSRVELLDVTRV